MRVMVMLTVYREREMTIEERLDKIERTLERIETKDIESLRFAVDEMKRVLVYTEQMADRFNC